MGKKLLSICVKKGAVPLVSLFEPPDDYAQSSVILTDAKIIIKEDGTSGRVYCANDNELAG